MTVSKFVFLLPFACSLPLQADLALFTVPETRGADDTAYASFDSFSGLSQTNATGSSAAEASHNLTLPTLTQSTPLSFPGGLKYTTATDLRIYTFSAAANFTLTATAQVPYQTATLQVSELVTSSFSEEEAENPTGFTGYTLSLNSTAPDSCDVTAFILDEETPYERTMAITTFTWNLPASTTDLDLSMVGYADAHDSIDAFSLDLAPATAQKPLPSPTLSLTNDEVTISWPASLTATLQSCSNLSDSDSWQNVEAAVTQTGEDKQVVLPKSSSPLFFRLHQ